MTLLQRDKPMTVAEFIAFTDTWPDEERWELIDGEPVLNPTPAWDHQRVVRNLLASLTRLEEQGTPWEVLPGLSVVLSNTRLPVPDVLLRPAVRIIGSSCVAIEVLSPTSKSRDLRWKRQAYADLPSVQHYVVVAPKAVDLRCYDRATNWQERRLQSPEDKLDLPAVGVSLKATALYRGL